jgi:LAS superfamily LD-carboxypeptidase LdcB
MQTFHKNKKIVIGLISFLSIVLVIFAFTVFTKKSFFKKEVLSPDIENSSSSFLKDVSSSISEQNSNKSEQTSQLSTQNSENQSSSVQILEKGFKKLSGLQFKDFYETIKYEKVDNLDIPPNITSNKDADQKIRKIAETRGYKLRHQAVESELVKVSGQRLQTQAKDSWIELETNAKKDGLNLVLVSGYRSVNDQRSLFMGDLNATGFGNQNIIDGLADKVIDEILQTRSIPGYSRHHTGFTFDIGCNSSNLLNFKTTPCYDWISKDNYYQAKKVGLIPSYPDGAGLQGPNPEEWEYVWIGAEKLK